MKLHVGAGRASNFPTLHLPPALPPIIFSSVILAPMRMDAVCGLHEPVASAPFEKRWFVCETDYPHAAYRAYLIVPR